MLNWTPDNAAEWKVIWEDNPTMQLGLLVLKEHCRVSGVMVVEPGIDLKEVASQSFAHAQGQSNLLEKIDAMFPVKQTAQLPPTFQPTPRPKTQQD